MHEVRGSGDRRRQGRRRRRRPRCRRAGIDALRDVGKYEIDAYRVLRDSLVRVLYRVIQKKLFHKSEERMQITSLVTPNVRCVHLPSSPPPPSLIIPSPPSLITPYPLPLSISVVENTRFRVFDKNALRTDGRKDLPIDMRGRI